MRSPVRRGESSSRTVEAFSAPHGAILRNGVSRQLASPGNRRLPDPNPFHLPAQSKRDAGGRTVETSCAICGCGCCLASGRTESCASDSPFWSAPCLRRLDPTATRWIVPTESFTAPKHAAGLLVVSYRAGPGRCGVRVFSFLRPAERAPVSLLLSEFFLGRIPQSRASAQGALQA